jgi:hypothetical protein
VFAELKAVIEGGFDPVDLARVVIEAVRRNDFWILPYSEFVPMMEQKNQEIIDALNAWRDRPDYARRMQLRQQSARDMPGVEGRKGG